jgi:AcrR family transcriptional regulator
VTRPTDTKDRILAAARELFVKQGVHLTSLQDIAARLGVTKPALYYHFASREALLASIVQPLLDDMDAFVVSRESAPRPDPRTLLADYFDLLLRHRELLAMLVRDLATLGVLDLAMRMIDWRRRLITLLLGPGASLPAQVRAVVAIGGMSDCTVEFPEVPMERIKATAIEAASAALGLPAVKAKGPKNPKAPPKTPKGPRPSRGRAS